MCSCIMNSLPPFGQNVQKQISKQLKQADRSEMRQDQCTWSATPACLWCFDRRWPTGEGCTCPHRLAVCGKVYLARSTTVWGNLDCWQVWLLCSFKKGMVLLIRSTQHTAFVFGKEEFGFNVWTISDEIFCVAKRNSSQETHPNVPVEILTEGIDGRTAASGKAQRDHVLQWFLSFFLNVASYLLLALRRNTKQTWKNKKETYDVELILFSFLCVAWPGGH